MGHMTIHGQPADEEYRGEHIHCKQDFWFNDVWCKWRGKTFVSRAAAKAAIDEYVAKQQQKAAETQQEQQGSQPSTPGWMSDRLNEWGQKQEDLFNKASEAYDYAKKMYETGWQQAGVVYGNAYSALQKGYGQNLGVLAQTASQQQSALARYAATGRMSGGSAEQSMIGSSRELAKGALSAYQDYAKGEAALGEAGMRTAAAFGLGAPKFADIVNDTMRSIPDPYRDWYDFMAGLNAYSDVAAT